MKNIKTILAAGAIALVLASAPAVAEKYETEKTQTFDVGSNASFKLRNISGDYMISGWDREVIEVYYIKKSKGNSAKLKADMVQVIAEQSGNRVFVEVKYPTSRERRARKLDSSFSVNIEFEVKVPMDCRIDVSTVSGDGEVLHVNGDVNACSTSGDVEATALAGNVKLYTTSGDIELTGGNGVIELKTTSGNVTADGVAGRVTMHTTSGDVELSAMELTEGSFKTVSGDINVSVEKPITTGTFALTVFSGSIEFYLPAESTFQVAAKAMHGNVESNFDLEFIRKRFQQEMRGTVNGGGAYISATSSNGDVEVYRK